MIYTVVFDTNILISAALSKSGSPNSCFSLAQSKLIRSVTCPEILQELSEKLLLKITVRKYIEEICEASTIVSIGGTLRAVPNDPDDDMIIECAIAGKATHIITGDKHLLSLVEYQNI
ncbi:MAG: putative toxin-antitoxin system toxin component, PIN family [Microcystis aeruginosa]